ncbi:MAG: lipoyl(octanoyl) transferase LipB [Deltaproteobacteria bacterium]|nr:lipoyl(octanoyl) transferase LipB [Deltaproteobacteria bacterium]
MSEIKLLKMGLTPYPEGLELMRRLVALKQQRPSPQVLLLLEHEPVLTMGRRAADNDILAPPELLKREGIAVHRVERGGLMTYHGPGQLVAYPLLDLNVMRLGVGDLVRALERTLLATLADLGVEGNLHEGHPGAWYGDKKLASIGVAVKRGISMHGLALNLDPNLEHFNLINPCGLTGASPMTSVRLVTGHQVDAAKARDLLGSHLCRELGLSSSPWTLERAEDCLMEGRLV